VDCKDVLDQADSAKLLSEAPTAARQASVGKSEFPRAGITLME